jgi:L-iditol 2-dehydrogenase
VTTAPPALPGPGLGRPGTASAGTLPATQRSAFLLGPERLEIREVPVPRPAAGELLVAIGAATTCGTDVKVFRRGGHPRMLKVPSPFGHEMAGTVAAVGAAASPAPGGGGGRFREGDRVAIANSAPCGVCRACRRGRENLCSDLLYLNGGFAEYLRVPPRAVERSVYPCPAGLPFEIAALAEPLACVLHGVETLEASGLDERPSEIVLFGSGPIGLLFVDLLTHRGHRVVAVDPNPQRLAVARRLGAAATVAVGRDGGESARVRRELPAPAQAMGFDVAIEASGSPAAWEDAVDAVAPGGLVLLFGGYPPATAVPLNAHRLHYCELTIRGAYHHRPATFARALDLLAGGGLTPGALLSAELPLARVEEALRSMMRRESLKVVIRP